MLCRSFQLCEYFSGRYDGEVLQTLVNMLLLSPFLNRSYFTTNDEILALSNQKENDM